MSIVGEVRDELVLASHYWAAMGLRNAVRFAWADLRGNKSVQEVHIGGERIFLRTATTDFKVADGILRNGDYRHAETSEPKVIVDVGANIGAVTLLYARKYPTAKIYAIEPEAGNFEMLKMNVGVRAGIVPIRQAIWSRHMTREIQNRRTGAWGYTLADLPADVQGMGQTVECVTMDEFMTQQGIGRIDILKMDIEGGEKEIFEHPEGWLDRVDMLAVELHDRICPGCTAAFERAVRDFPHRRQDGEKVLVWRDPRP